MATWSGGYHTDTPYAPGYYREQAPAHLALAAAICGGNSPSASRPYHYLELGCGQGLTLALLAAANPESTFHGTDFLPAHIVLARQLADAAGLENVFFHEASFQDWVSSPPPGLPAFDFITAHGIYTWVPEEARRALRALLNCHLAPGGMVQISYNTLPGQATTIPIQRILYDYCAQGQGSSEARIGQAVSFLSRFHQASSLKTLDEHVMRRLEKRLRLGMTSYLAHEYLNRAWTPCFPQDVMAEMAEVKLDFLGDADLMQNAIEVMLPEALRPLLAEVTDPGLRQCVLDLVNGRTLRRDLYVRGLTRLPTYRRVQALCATRLALAAPESRLKYEISVPVGTAQLDEKAYRPIFAALAEGPRTAQELAMISQSKGGNASVLEVAGSLVGAELALPLTTAAPGPERVQKFTRAYYNWSRLSDRPGGCHIPSGIGGGGVLLDLFELLTLVCLIDGVTPTPAAVAAHGWKLMASRGDQLLEDGQPVSDKARTVAMLQENAERVFRESVPMWKGLGVLSS